MPTKGLQIHDRNIRSHCANDPKQSPTAFSSITSCHHPDDETKDEVELNSDRYGASNAGFTGRDDRCHRQIRLQGVDKGYIRNNDSTREARVQGMQTMERRFAGTETRACCHAGTQDGSSSRQGSPRPYFEQTLPLTRHSYDHYHVDHRITLPGPPSHEVEGDQASDRRVRSNTGVDGRIQGRQERKEGPFEGVHCSHPFSSSGADDYRRLHPPLSPTPTCFANTHYELCGSPIPFDDCSNIEADEGRIWNSIGEERRSPIPETSRILTIANSKDDFTRPIETCQGQIPRRIYGWPMVGGIPREEATGCFVMSPPEPGLDRRLGEAKDLPGVTQASQNVQISGYYFDGIRKVPLSKEDLFKGTAALNDILKDLTLKQNGEPEDYTAGDVAALPGMSSSSPFVRVKIGREWVSLKPKTSTTLPLADLDVNVADAQRIYKAALLHDPGLAKMVNYFLLGNDQHLTELFIPPTSMHVSTKFSDKDITMLQSKGIIRAGKIPFALPAFKVPKKEPKARFILDCRTINESFHIFEGEEMEIENLYRLTDWGLKYPVIWSVDGNAYFFQFQLRGHASTMFPVMFEGKRKGSNVCAFLDRLPMGFKLAPAIAQRISNLVVKATQHRIDKNKFDAKVAAWVDNFIVFAPNEGMAEKVMNILKKQLTHFNIKFKETDKSNSFLGLHRNADGLQLQDTWTSAFKAEVEALSSESPIDVNRIQQALGKAIWVNYAVVRTPLCVFPHTLRLARRLPFLMNNYTYITKEELDELRLWTCLSSHRMAPEAQAPAMHTIWSDARPHILSLVSEKRVFIATLPFPIEIAIAETMAAVWGAILYNRRVHMIVDNTTAAYAIAKGHCLSPSVNILLSKLYEYPIYGKVSWISTEFQVADAPTRGALPILDPRDVSKCSDINSLFLRIPGRDSQTEE